MATPIYELQTMLRRLESTKQLASDGIYGEKTARAVRAFQEANGLPPTGQTDQATWDAVRRAYASALILTDEAEPLRLALDANQVIERGSDNLHLPLIQAMLHILRQFFPEMPQLRFTGVLDEQTAQAIAWFQNRANLPQTGEIDRFTWRALAKHYRLTVGNGTGSFPVRIAAAGEEMPRS